MTLDDLKYQNKGFYGFFWRFRPGQVYIIHKAAPRYWRWWRDVVANAFRLKRSYCTPGPVSTAMGDCLWVGTAIGFRTSREHSSNFLYNKPKPFRPVGGQVAGQWEQGPRQAQQQQQQVGSVDQWQRIRWQPCFQCDDAVHDDVTVTDDAGTPAVSGPTVTLTIYYLNQTQLALVLFPQLLAAVVNHKANDGNVVYAI